MSGKGMKALILLGSARENRLGDRVYKFMSKQLKTRGWSVDVLDPVEMNLPILQKPIFFYKDDEEKPKVLTDALQKIKDADAFVIITCEYNHSLPPGLVNTIDHFPPTSFAKRPSSLVTYSPGIYGGMRAAMQARCLLGEIKTVSIPHIFGMPRVNKSLDEEGNPTDDHMVPGAEAHISELEWYASALKAHRTASP